MPPPTNNQAPTTDYATAFGEFGSVYDPQTAQVNTQIAALAPAQAQQQSQLDQAKANAFSNNALTANARGINFSGYAPMQNTNYTKTVYDPNVTRLNTSFTNQKQSLQDKITAINQQRANDAHSLVQSTQKAQAEAAAQAAAEAARAQATTSRAAGGGSSSSGGKPSQAQITTAISSGLAKVTGKDGYVAPEDYAQAYLDWINSGGSTSSFNSNFGRFKNPQNGYYNYAITQALKRG